MKKKNLLEKGMVTLFTLCGFVSIAFVIIITVFLVISGIPAIREIGLIKFLFGKVWASTAQTPSYGILPFILTSVYGTFGAMVIGVPIGILCAAYIAKMES